MSASAEPRTAATPYLLAFLDAATKLVNDGSDLDERGFVPVRDIEKLENDLRYRLGLSEGLTGVEGGPHESKRSLQLVARHTDLVADLLRQFAVLVDLVGLVVHQSSPSSAGGSAETVDGGADLLPGPATTGGAS